MARPPFEIEGFIGQRTVLTPVIREQDGALARSEPMPHTLVLGPSGIGKTVLFSALARRAKVDVVKVVGKASLRKVCDALLRLKANDFLVFDEAHNQDAANQEMLYEVIDEHAIPARYLSSDESAVAAEVPPCTIVFATDQPGKLLNALQKRLPQRVWLRDYSLEEMREIVARIAQNLNILLSAQAARQIASVSNGLPRRARDYLRSLRRFFPKSEQSQIGVPQVEEYLQSHQITLDGLSRAEIDYLRLLHDGDKASIETIAAYLGVDSEYVRTQVEQQLLYRKFVRIGGGGRSLTMAGMDRIASLPPTADVEDESGTQSIASTTTSAKEVANG